MKKKIYEKPTVEVVMLQYQCQLLEGSKMEIFDKPEDVITEPGLVW